MSLEFLDGFEHTSAIADFLDGLYDTASGSVVTTPVRTGSRAYRAQDWTEWLRRPLSANQTTVGVGFFLTPLVMPPTDNTQALVRWADSAGFAQVTLGLQNDGQLAIYRGGLNGALLAETSANLIRANVGSHLEIRATIDDVNGSVELRVDETTVASAAGVDTKNTANAGCDFISIGQAAASPGGDLVFDDLFIWNGSGTTNNDFIGAKQVHYMPVVGGGAPNDWTIKSGGSGATWEQIDELDPDDATTVVQSTSDGDVSKFQLKGLPPTVGFIAGAMSLTRHRKLVGSSRKVKTSLAFVGASSDGATVQSMSTFEYTDDIHETDPETTTAWQNHRLSLVDLKVERFEGSLSEVAAGVYNLDDVNGRFHVAFNFADREWYRFSDAGAFQVYDMTDHAIKSSTVIWPDADIVDNEHIMFWVPSAGTSGKIITAVDAKIGGKYATTNRVIITMDKDGTNTSSNACNFGADLVRADPDWTQFFTSNGRAHMINYTTLGNLDVWKLSSDGATWFFLGAVGSPAVKYFIGQVDNTNDAYIYYTDTSDNIVRVVVTAAGGVSYSQVVAAASMPTHSGNLPQDIFLLPGGDVLVKFVGTTVVKRMTFTAFTEVWSQTGLAATDMVFPHKTTSSVTERCALTQHTTLDCDMIDISDGSVTNLAVPNEQNTNVGFWWDDDGGAMWYHNNGDDMSRYQFTPRNLGVVDGDPEVEITQAGVYALAADRPCATYRADVWIITRTDGQVFAFTSHDKPITFKGQTAIPCYSLNESASEIAAMFGEVGNLELAGIVDHDNISEPDLFSGKFDHAEVEVWRVPWAGTDVDAPERISKGRIGQTSHGTRGWTGEVLTPGAQIQQQGVTQKITPACRFGFMDRSDEGLDGRCPVTKASLQVTGTVTSVATADPDTLADHRVFADTGRTEADGEFELGEVTWTSGDNNGQKSEVKKFVSDTFTLWEPMMHPIKVGDTYSAFPGCNKTKARCTGFTPTGVAKFGGFDQVPGLDDVIRTPDVKQ